MDPKKPIVPRRVWRMTAETPLGEFLDLVVPKSTVLTETTVPPKRTFHPETTVPLNRTVPLETTVPRETTAEPPREASAKVLTPAKVPSWRASSYDLLMGLSVRDVSDTIPGGIFDELFKPDRPT